MNVTVTTKHNPTVDNTKYNERNLNITLKASNQKGKKQEKNKGTERNYKNRQKTILKMPTNID